MKKFNVIVNGVTYDVAVDEVFGAATPAPVVVSAPVTAAPAQVGAGDTTVNAPMPGKIVKLLLEAGQIVKKGEVVLILEAMKMQNEITAPVAGTVKSLQVTAGQNVKPGEILAVIG